MCQSTGLVYWCEGIDKCWKEQRRLERHLSCKMILIFRQRQGRNFERVRWYMPKAFGTMAFESCHSMPMTIGVVDTATVGGHGAWVWLTWILHGYEGAKHSSQDNHLFCMFLRGINYVQSSTLQPFVFSFRFATIHIIRVYFLVVY